MAACGAGRHRQPSWRVRHMGPWAQRWGSGSAPLPAGAPSSANHRLGRASPHPGRVSSRVASAADSAPAISACLGRAGGLASAFSPGFTARLALCDIPSLHGSAQVYGRHAVHLWSGTLQRWSTPLLCVFVGLLAAGIGFGIWRVRGLRKPDAAAVNAA